MKHPQTLTALSDTARLATRLQQAGMTTQAAGDKARLFALAAKSLAGHNVSPETQVFAFFVPGRIEVLGKHTDYGGGRSIVMAVERGFCMIVHPRNDASVNLINAATGDVARFDLNPDLSPILGHWSNYPMTVARRVARNFPGKLRGADIAFYSDLPLAAGMSSSSALVVATFLAFNAANDLHERDEYKKNIHSIEDLAGYLGTNENGQTFGTLVGDKGVGTFGGSEDHTAILCAKPGHISEYTYCPVVFQHAIRVPGDYIFAVGSSGVHAEKTGDAMQKYNRASKLASAVLETWRKTTGRNDPTLAAAIQSSPDAVARFRELLTKSSHGDFTPRELVTRFDHFHLESNDIIPQAREALLKGDVISFGNHVNRSQEATDTLLGNQVPQTIFLAQSAREAGAAAASAFGAGFGGSVWALVQKSKVEQFLNDWKNRYEKAHHEQARHATFFPTAPGPAAFAVK